MKNRWKMPPGLQPCFQNEVAAHEVCFKRGEYQTAWRHLERAHILSQPWAVEHSFVHWTMLRFGLRIKNWHEVLGQIPRLMVGGVKSFVGKVPVGNTGGSNVPPLQPMEIPDDIKELMRPFV